MALQCRSALQRQHFGTGKSLSLVLTLVKVLIPNKDRDDSLRSLNRMNINHLSLFPDLAGASMFCNLHSEVDRY